MLLWQGKTLVTSLYLILPYSTMLCILEGRDLRGIEQGYIIEHLAGFPCKWWPGSCTGSWSSPPSTTVVPSVGKDFCCILWSGVWFQSHRNAPAPWTCTNMIKPCAQVRAANKNSAARWIATTSGRRGWPCWPLFLFWKASLALASMWIRKMPQRASHISMNPQHALDDVPTSYTRRQLFGCFVLCKSVRPTCQTHFHKDAQRPIKTHSCPFLPIRFLFEFCQSYPWSPLNLEMKLRPSSGPSPPPCFAESPPATRQGQQLKRAIGVEK